MVEPADILDVEQLWLQVAEGDETAKLERVNHPAGGGGKDWVTCKSGLLLVTELYKGTNDHLSQLEDCKLRNIDELIEWNEENPASPCDVECLIRC